MKRLPNLLPGQRPSASHYNQMRQAVIATNDRTEMVGIGSDDTPIQFQPVMVKVAGTDWGSVTLGGGKYRGIFVWGDAGCVIDPASPQSWMETDLEMPEGLVETGDEASQSCIILNFGESTGHAIATDTYLSGHIIGMLASVPVVGVGGVSSTAIMVKISSAASGGGKYNGRSFTYPTSDISASSTLGDSDYGTLASTEDCLVLNGAEQGKTTHDLTAGTPVSTVFPGVLIKINSNGIKVVGINGYDYENCA